MSHNGIPSSATVRLAVIRGLGQIGSTGARNALEAAADSNADPVTQQRATAELRTLRRSFIGGK